MTNNQTQNPDTTHLTALEDRLVADSDGTVKQELLNELYDEAVRLKGELNRGLAPDQYETSSTVITALVAAAEVVHKTWESHHAS